MQYKLKELIVIVESFEPYDNPGRPVYCKCGNPLPTNDQQGISYLKHEGYCVQCSKDIVTSSLQQWEQELSDEDLKNPHIAVIVENLDLDFIRLYLETENLDYELC